MIKIAVTVEDHGVDTGGLGHFGDCLAHHGCLFALRNLCVADVGGGGGCGDEGMAGEVINQLHIDVAVTSVNRHSRTFGSAADSLANSLFNPVSSVYFLISHCTKFLRLFISGLTGFLSNHFAHETDTFSFVGFRFTIGADLVADLAEELFVVTFEGDDGVFTFLGHGIDFDFFGEFEDDVVGVAERHGQQLALDFSLIGNAHELELSLEAFGDTLHHVSEEGAIEAVEGAVAALVGGAFHYEVAVFNLGSDIGIELLVHFAAGALNGDDIRLFVNFNLYTFRESDG